MNSKDGVGFALLFTLWSSLSATTQHVGKAGGIQILRCQGIAVGNYSFIPDALTLKPSDFCNDVVFKASDRFSKYQMIERSECHKSSVFSLQSSIQCWVSIPLITRSYSGKYWPITGRSKLRSILVLLSRSSRNSNDFSTSTAGDTRLSVNFS